jgi:hypothetical protein
MITSAAATGGCFCGAVRYRVTGEPLYSGICHCHSCRRISGAPAVAWVTFPRDQFEFLQGDPTLLHSTAAVVRRFCGACGSPLTYETTDHLGSLDVTTATLDEPNLYPPKTESWMEDKLTWHAANPKLKHFRRGMVEG